MNLLDKLKIFMFEKNKASGLETARTTHGLENFSLNGT